MAAVAGSIHAAQPTIAVRIRWHRPGLWVDRLKTVLRVAEQDVTLPGTTVALRGHAICPFRRRWQRHTQLRNDGSSRENVAAELRSDIGAIVSTVSCLAFGNAQSVQSLGETTLCRWLTCKSNAGVTATNAVVSLPTGTRDRPK